MAGLEKKALSTRDLGPVATRTAWIAYSAPLGITAGTSPENAF